MPNQAPTDISVSQTFVLEHRQLSQAIATLGATDADSTALTFELLNYTDTFVLSGNQLSFREDQHDVVYAETPFWDLQYRVTDDAGASYEETIRLDVRQWFQPPSSTILVWREGSVENILADPANGQLYTEFQITYIPLGNIQVSSNELPGPITVTDIRFTPYPGLIYADNISLSVFNIRDPDFGIDRGAYYQFDYRMRVVPDAREPDLTLGAATASGVEDTAIALPSIVAARDAVWTGAGLNDDTLAVTLTGIPVGATVGDGAHSFTATAGTTSVDITGWGALTLTPAAGYYGTFTLTVAARTTDADTVDGVYYFDEAQTTASLAVTVARVNETPTLGQAAVAGATDEATAYTVTVGQLLTQADYADEDTDNGSGVAISAAGGQGSWSYSLDGTTWMPLGSVSAAAARLLPASAQLRYTPGADQAETATLTFRGWDQASGSAGGTGDSTATQTGSAYTASSATLSVAVANVNDAPTGTVVIGGTATEGQTLTAANTLADADGLGTVTYQWRADGADIAGATSSTLTLGQAQVGHAISVVARYTDGGGTAEAVSAMATATVANVNDTPAGAVTISGTATQGQTLTAANTLADADGLGTVSYQWQADGADIAGATGATLALGQAQVGHAISVLARYTDGGGTAEQVASGATAAVADVAYAPTGAVTITGTAAQGQTLTASNTLADLDGLGTIAYQWQADGADIAGATGTTLTLTQAQVGQAIRVIARYTDGGGTAEQVGSAATAAVANVNDAPTGSVTIGGTATEGQTLTASSTLADADGLGTISYQWRAGGADLAGATGATFTPAQAQVGQAISVVARYTDGGGTVEQVSSIATASVANVLNAPTGAVVVSGTATEGQTLTVANSLGDADGLGPVSYQWRADGADIAGATGATLTLAQAQVGRAISVIARYTDGGGDAEQVASAATSAVSDVAHAPTGVVTITGTAAQGQTLTASNTLADLDGLGTIAYQWQADGSDIAGATGTTLTLTQVQVGHAISVIARYTDGGGAAEQGGSTATAAVVNVNDAPTGSVTISGTATEGESLTAANTLADADGMGSVSYQWRADGADIAGATGAALTLTQAQVGQAISVVARYTDGGGTAEQLASTATSAVANVNDAPTGAVTIGGTASQGETLTAANDLADADGLGAVSYQWQADGQDISGATGSSLTLAFAQVGRAISVVARYTDGFGAAEQVASASTAPVTQVNTPPTGAVTISGAATQGQTLTAANTLADTDGMGAVTYQWRADGADIAGATGSTLTLAQAQVGHAISVAARYTDGGGTAEQVASAATSAVANVNDLPTGAVSISGAATQGATLTAANTLADVDGVGTIVYQWRADGADISGATGSAFTLTQAQVGRTIDVVARYTDGGGSAEQAASAATGVVANVDDPPTGGLTVSGTAVVGATLMAVSTVADADGMGVVTYQWLRDGVAISGATGTSYPLGAADVGSQVGVELSYTDGGGRAEHFASGLTIVQAAPSDPPPPPPPSNPTTTEVIGGLTVTTQVETRPDGSRNQTITVPSTGGTGVSDVPIAKAANGQPLLVAQTPAGFGLQVTGAAEPRPAAAAGADLLQAVGGGPAAAGATTFLQGLPAGESLLVETVTLTLAPGATPGPLRIAGQAAGGPTTALVIDARALPAGAALVLDNVDFAVVVGAVRVTGGDGSQTAWGDGAGQYMVLGADDDVLHGGAGADTVGSAAGNDQLFGDEGDDVVFGGDGSDFLHGNAGADSVSGDAGADIAYGGKDNDTVGGGAGADLLFGDLGDDALQGNTGADSLDGGAGADTVHGGQDRDVLQGGEGNDLVFGDAGADVVRGGKGDDRIWGGDGDDWLSGDRGADTLSGGAGADTFHTFAGAGLDLVTDFSRAEGDRIYVAPGTVYSLAQVGADTVIDLGGGDRMVLAGVQLSSLDSGWIVVA